MKKKKKKGWGDIRKNYDLGFVRSFIASCWRLDPAFCQYIIFILFPIRQDWSLK